LRTMQGCSAGWGRRAKWRSWSGEQRRCQKATVRRN